MSPEGAAGAGGADAAPAVIARGADAAPAVIAGGADDAADVAPAWTRWFTAASIVFAAAALTATVWSVGPRTLLERIAEIGLGFAAVLAIEAVATACDAAALSGFIGAGGRRPSYLYVVRAQIVGRAINAVTPLASLGEATKATALMERTSTPRAIGAVIRYNLSSVGIRLVTIALGAPLCALVLDVPAWLAGLLVAGAALALVLLALGVLLVRRGMLGSAVGALRAIRAISVDRARRWRGKLDRIDQQLRTGKAGPRRQRWTPVGWVALSRVLTLFSAWVVLASTGHTAGVATMAAVATAGQLISVAASVVPMGLGLSEAGNAALFAALGEPPSLGVAMVLGSRITMLAYATLGLALVGTASVVAVRRRGPRHRRVAGAAAR